eukprot:TRINITY_DN3809_c0_g2_i1.p1 TRINITY_DN3809_c0_g2~~TRINITY_DN3809_c0_g2_i1.p1  ORF type:complete len:714 (-),score=128.78 TRINITY_DN3809_c0_g2_i1:124-2265(-)
MTKMRLSNIINTHLIFYSMLNLCISLILVASQEFGEMKETKEFTHVLKYSGGSVKACDSCVHGECEPTHLCSYDDNWNDGEQSFKNPMEPGYLLQYITLNMTGSFRCYFNSDSSEVQIIFASIEIVKLNLPPLPGLCYPCPNCMVEHSINSTLMVGGWPGYKYKEEDQNTFTINVLQNDICLSEISIHMLGRNIIPNIQSITPSQIPISSEKRRVLVTATNFLQLSKMQYYCIYSGFEDHTIYAEYNSPTEVYCPVPANISKPTITSIRVLPFSPVVPPEDKYPIFVTFYDLPKLKYVLPDTVQTDGGMVAIFGNGFFKTDYLYCKFEDIESSAIFISEKQVNCTAPKHGSGIVTLEFSENGFDYGTDKLQLKYNSKTIPWSDLTNPNAFVDMMWIIGGSIFLLVTISLTIGVIIWQRRSKQENYQVIPEIDDEKAIINIKEIKLKERIGRGGFGDVYKAYWRGTIVAVKKVSAKNVKDDLIAELYTEANIMLQLRHPNVLTFMGVCTERPDICIITEYMEKGPLYRILNDKSYVIEPSHIKKFCLDISRGMQYLHAARIIHRDLKSHNILIDTYWNVKVCDFGLSRRIGENVTNTMTACGTPCWTAPEVLRNERYEESADVYSFSICLWEMIARKEPFVGRPPFQVVIAVANDGLRPIIPENSCEEYAELIIDCWNEEPALRPTFDEITTILESFNFPDPLHHNPYRSRGNL